MNGPVYSPILGDVIIGNTDLADSCAWEPTHQARPSARDLPIYPAPADLPPPPPGSDRPFPRGGAEPPLPADQRAQFERSFGAVFGSTGARR